MTSEILAITTKSCGKIQSDSPATSLSSEFMRNCSVFGWTPLRIKRESDPRRIAKILTNLVAQMRSVFFESEIYGLPQKRINFSEWSFQNVCNLHKRRKRQFPSEQLPQSNERDEITCLVVVWQLVFFNFVFLCSENKLIYSFRGDEQEIFHVSRENSVFLLAKENDSIIPVTTHSFHLLVLRLRIDSLTFLEKAQRQRSEKMAQPKNTRR